METIGKFEFSRKDLIGHGAFAVVFKGRHKAKHDCEVAVKCINKKNLAKSQSLLGKEIKILKELKHENIVGLLDYQETGGCVYLVMEYCNGGDLAEYLHTKGTLSEDTIRVFLQQITQAMKVLQGKGIIHRDLKPQNILLCHPDGRRSNPNNICFKLADFGFARHLQTNTMAATLCGSPMYMAPEVIMSQNYDAKADLWSIGTVLYQCLTGKAPFHASTPQELRLFYESNRNLLPSIPRETSSHLRHLLLGLLQRNHRERMNYDEFFHHPFMESSSTMKKSSSVPMHLYPSSGSGSSSSSSSTSNVASPLHSKTKPLHIPRQEPPGFLLKEAANQDNRNSFSDTEEYVMVPPVHCVQFPNDFVCELGDGSPTEGSLIYSGSSLLAERGLENAGKTPPSSPSLSSSPNPVSKPVDFSGSNYSRSVAIPVPTQVLNYQRMELNLQPAGLHGSTRAMLYCPGSSNESSPGCGRSRAAGLSPVLRTPRLMAGGAWPHPPSPQVGATPKISKHSRPLSTKTGMPAGSPDMARSSDGGWHKIQGRNHDYLHGSPSPKPPTLFPCRRMTVPNLRTLGLMAAENKQRPFKRSLSTGRLSDMLLKAAFGAHLVDGGSDESLCSDKNMDTTAPPSGYTRYPGTQGGPNHIFTPSRRNTCPDITATRGFSGSPSNISPSQIFCNHLLHRRSRGVSESEAMEAAPHRSMTFHPPELPEDTLMEQPHTDALADLRFTLAFVHCVIEIASSKDSGPEASDSPDLSFLEQSLVADQISLLSREWSNAERLVLYMKAEEFLSSALRTAKEDIKQGRLLPSVTAKQVIKKLNDSYKSCVSCCRSLTGRLQSFLLDKQRLIDRFNGITAEKLIYSHTVQMVQSAALDEMFHRGQASVQRYHKAFLLMEGLSRIITEPEDIDNIDKCKQCIERRLSALET